MNIPAHMNLSVEHYQYMQEQRSNRAMQATWDTNLARFAEQDGNPAQAARYRKSADLNWHWYEIYDEWITNTDAEIMSYHLSA